MFRGPVPQICFCCEPLRFYIDKKRQRSDFTRDWVPLIIVVCTRVGPIINGGARGDISVDDAFQMSISRYRITDTMVQNTKHHVATSLKAGGKI